MKTSIVTLTLASSLLSQMCIAADINDQLNKQGKDAYQADKALNWNRPGGQHQSEKRLKPFLDKAIPKIRANYDSLFAVLNKTDSTDAADDKQRRCDVGVGFAGGQKFILARLSDYLFSDMKKQVKDNFEEDIEKMGTELPPYMAKHYSNTCPFAVEQGNEVKRIGDIIINLLNGDD